MQIDWITVAAQIVNFLILVWLLKRFLYGPIVRAMQRREQHITDRLGEADRKLAEAKAKAESYEAKARELEGKRDALMREARRDAEDHRKHLREEVEQEVARERQARRDQLARERRDLLRDLRRQLGEQVVTLARRAMTDLADRDLEAQVAEIFAQKLDALDAELRRRIAQDAGADDGRLTVRSAFELPQPARTRIADALHDAFGAGLEPAYEVDDALICGIELRAAGHSVLWSLDSYLDAFEQRFGQSLDEMAAAGETAAAA